MKNPSFYIYIQNRLCEFCDGDKVVDLERAKWKIINMKIPIQLVNLILKEMEGREMGEFIDNSKYKLKNIRCNKEINSIIQNHC